MPAPEPTLGIEEIYRFARERAFPASFDESVGLEVEWIVSAPGARDDRPDLAALANAVHAAGPLPGGSAVSFEPGGQLELSSPTFSTATDACTAVARDSTIVEQVAARQGLVLVGVGYDPIRRPRRILDAPRYSCMEDYFRQASPSGVRMMANTAAVQVNVGFGPDPQRRWRLAHLIGPTLVAAFANSPIARGVPSGWRSVRMATWLATDPTRTAPVGARGGAADAWARYLSRARVMLVRRSVDDFRTQREPLPFLRWMMAGHEYGFPTLDDLEYHASTLFPPVRPRGWIELRMIDMLPAPWWVAATAVTTALLLDDEASSRARRAASPAAGLWREAARHGLAHPALAASARACFAAAIEVLMREGAGDEVTGAAWEYCERYVLRNRTPADDALDAWGRRGGMEPALAWAG